MDAIRAGELEYLVTADTSGVAKAEKTVQETAKRIEGKPAKVKVDADAKPALDGMDQVEEAAKRIVSADTVARVDADISKAESETERLQKELDYLRSISTDVQVDADIQKAEGKLQRTERMLGSLRSARATMKVDADTAPAETALDDIADEAGDAGAEGGEKAGSGLEGGILKALQAIPIAGGIVLAGVAIGKSILDGITEGLQVEVRQDRLQALTGIDENSAARLARAAGEAYANNFGESIESNMDLTRLAVQFDLIDPAASVRDSQAVIEGLAGIADVLGEDVQPVAQTVTQLLKTGLVSSAEEAFDVLATGAREGVNRSEDLLDTLSEYSSTFSSLGLDAETALGLMNQGLEAGAPNTDFFADSLRELGIRVRENDDAINEFIEDLGLVPGDLRAAFAEGGPAAAEGLDSLFDALNQIEDPAERNRLAVGLLGTQFEDLQLDLSAIDVSTAVDGLNGVTGAAQAMFDTIADNDASQIETAKRNIEVAADGIKGALASAFADPLADAAEFITQNRGPVLEFFGAIVNGALDFGESAIIGAANASVAFGDLVSGPLADTVDAIGGMLDGLEPLVGLIPGLGSIEINNSLEQLADEMRNVDDTSQDTADSILGLIDPLDQARTEFNEFFDPQVAQGYLHDATLRLAGAIDAVGYAADGTTPLVDAYTIATDGSVQAGGALQSQVEASIAALDQEALTAAAAGESQADLSARYLAGRDALMNQLVAMGLTEDQAYALIDSYGGIPSRVDTVVNSNAVAVGENVSDLSLKIEQLPDGSFVVTANTSGAQAELDRFIRDNQGRRIRIDTDLGGGQSVNTGSGNQIARHDGGVVEFYAGGGLRRMEPIAQMVPPNTWRVVGDRAVDDEAYIPINSSARSMAILLETMRRMGVQPMAAGGVVGSRREPHPTASRTINVYTTSVRTRDIVTADRTLDLLEV